MLPEGTGSQFLSWCEFYSLRWHENTCQKAELSRHLCKNPYVQAVLTPVVALENAGYRVSPAGVLKERNEPAPRGLAE